MWEFFLFCMFASGIGFALVGVLRLWLLGQKPAGIIIMSVGLVIFVMGIIVSTQERFRFPVYVIAGPIISIGLIVQILIQWSRQRKAQQPFPSAHGAAQFQPGQQQSGYLQQSGGYSQPQQQPGYPGGQVPQQPGYQQQPGGYSQPQQPGYPGGQMPQQPGSFPGNPA